MTGFYSLIFFKQNKVACHFEGERVTIEVITNVEQIFKAQNIDLSIKLLILLSIINNKIAFHKLLTSLGMFDMPFCSVSFFN